MFGIGASYTGDTTADGYGRPQRAENTTVLD